MKQLNKFSIDEIKKFVAETNCFSQIFKKMNINYNGGNFSSFKKLLIANNINFSHYSGSNWRKGLDAIKDERIGGKYSKIFCEKSSYSRPYVRTLIINNNLILYKCKCGISNEWNGEKIVLDLDHINGNRNDHRLENLRFLCPNCHSQTSTYKGKNIKKQFVSDELLCATIPISFSMRDVCSRLNLSDGSNNNRIKKLMSTYNLIFLKKEIKKKKRISDNEPFWRNRPKEHKRKVNRPNKNYLVDLLKEKSVESIARQFNVTGNSIRKWCKCYNVNIKTISPFSHKRSVVQEQETQLLKS